MTLTLAAVLLNDICLDLQFGRPVWAILRANEYLEKNDKLRIALVRKVKPEVLLNDELSHKILHDGLTLGQLSDSQKEVIRTIDTGIRPLKRYFILRNRDAKKRRKIRLTTTKRPCRSRPSLKVQIPAHKIGSTL